MHLKQIQLSGGSSRALLVGALAVRSLTYPASALGDIFSIATPAIASSEFHLGFSRISKFRGWMLQNVT